MRDPFNPFSYTGPDPLEDPTIPRNRRAVQPWPGLGPFTWGRPAAPPAPPPPVPTLTPAAQIGAGAPFSETVPPAPPPVVPADDFSSEQPGPNQRLPLPPPESPFEGFGMLPRGASISSPPPESSPQAPSGPTPPYAQSRGGVVPQGDGADPARIRRERIAALDRNAPDFLEQVQRINNETVLASNAEGARLGTAVQPIAPAVAPPPGGANVQPLSQTTSPPPASNSDADILTQFDSATGRGSDGPPRDIFGMSPTDWFAAAGGFFSGRNSQESMGNGFGALARQGNLRQADQAQREQRAEDRATRRQNLQMSLSERREDRSARATEAAANRANALLIARERISAVGDNGGNVQSSEALVGPDNAPYVRITRRDGTVQFRDGSNQVVTDPNILRSLERRQDTGSGAGNREIATQDVKDANGVFAAGETARTMRQATANARGILQQNPNIVGPDWPTRAQRFLVEALGVPVGNMRPQDVAALEQALMTGQMQQVMQAAEFLRPMSNVDLQMLIRQAPSVMSNPQLLPAWLDQIDNAAARAEERAAALRAARPDPAAIRRMQQEGGTAAWLQSYESSRRSGRPEPNITPGPGGNYQFRSNSGVGFTLPD